MRKSQYQFLSFNMIHIGLFAVYQSTKHILYQTLEEKGYHNTAYFVNNTDIITEIIYYPATIPGKIYDYAVSQAIDYAIESSEYYISQAIDYGIEKSEYYISEGSDYIKSLLGYDDNSNNNIQNSHCFIKNNQNEIEYYLVMSDEDYINSIENNISELELNGSTEYYLIIDEDEDGNITEYYFEVINEDHQDSITNDILMNCVADDSLQHLIIEDYNNPENIIGASTKA